MTLIASARQIRCGSKLLSEALLDPSELGEGGSAFLLRETGTADIAALAPGWRRRRAAQGLWWIGFWARVGMRDMGRRAMDLGEADPKGLIRESYLIEGITPAECRSIFMDWALSLPTGGDPLDTIRTVLAEHGMDLPDHPMTRVLTSGLLSPEAPRRRGGRTARVGG